MTGRSAKIVSGTTRKLAVTAQARRITCRLAKEPLRRRCTCIWSLSAAMQGGPVFVVDDILLTYFVLPYAKRLLAKGQNQLYDWLDGQGVKLARRGLRLWQHRPTDIEVLTDLGHYADEHPGTADTLFTGVLTTELQTAALLPAPEADKEVLRIVSDFLTHVFKMVEALGWPAVLPGFLTGTDYLAVIDVRTPPGRQLEMPSVGGQDVPAITLWSPPGPIFTPDSVHWMPRLWLISTTDEELAAALKAFASDRDKTPTSAELAATLKDQSFVTGITRRNVLVRHVEMVVAGSPPIAAPTGEITQIPWAESPDGVKAMLKELTSQLGERQQQDLLWKRAIAQLFRPEEG